MAKTHGPKRSSSEARSRQVRRVTFVFIALGVLPIPLLWHFMPQLMGTSASGAAQVNSSRTIATATKAATTQATPTARTVGTPTTGATSTPLTEQWQVVLAAARAQIGAPYAQYGDTPQTGFSCVGLVHWSFAQAGITVPESEEGLANTFPHIAGATPAGAKLLPGDVLIFHDTGLPGLSHAAIYAGNGKMVSADSPEVGIREEIVNSPFWVAHWSLAVRVPGLTLPASASHS